MPVILDYKAGNVRSVQRACKHVGMDAAITADPDEIRRADRLIFPGVGSAVSAVDTLAERGLDEAIVEFFKTGKPLLGICLGLQIALDFTEEGEKDCLGLVPGICKRFAFADKRFSGERLLKVPQIGWNQVEFRGEHPMFKRNQSGDDFYFVHSYHAVPKDESHCLGWTEYGDITFAAVIARDNFFATQFHLEKSGELGLKMLASFAEWDGEGNI